MEVGERAVKEASRRTHVLNAAERYLVEELGLPAEDARRRCAALEGPLVRPVEFAHTPQLPHLGIVRALLRTRDLAAEQGGVFLYCVNDHLPAKLLSESRYVPVTTDDGEVGKPPRFGPGKSRAKGGMHREDPPSQDTVAALVDRLVELLDTMPDRSEALLDVLERARASTGNFAAWLVRVQLELLSLTPVVVPTSNLAACLPEEAERYFASRPDGRWSTCASCGYRVQGAAMASCPACGDSGWDPSTDVIGRQLLLNATGIGLRVCGRRKDYQGVADDASASVVGSPAPPRVRITGSTVVGRLAAPVPRMNLLQAFLELQGAWPPVPPDDDTVDWSLPA